jgi:hypothetical protein
MDTFQVAELGHGWLVYIARRRDMPTMQLRTALAAIAMAACMIAASASAASATAGLAHRLAQHAGILSNAAGNAPVPQASRYIETVLASMGYEVMRREQTQDGYPVQEITASLPRSPGAAARSLIVGSSHLPVSPDQGAATSAVIELARLLRHVAPAAGTEVTFVFLIRGFGSPYPESGNFLAFRGTRAELDKVRRVMRAFRPLAAPEGLAASAYLEGVTCAGTLMVTGTGFLHYPYMRARQPVFDDMAPVVDNLARVLARLAAPPAM